MATVNERIQAQRKAGNLPASIKNVYDACLLAKQYLDAYSDGVNNPSGINGEFSNQVQLLFTADELTELGIVLNKAADLYNDYTVNNPWIPNIE